MSLKLRHIALWLTMASALTGCALVDEDMRDCEADHRLSYELSLVTNLTTEIQTQLKVGTDVYVASALEGYLRGIFTDYAHDVDLSFYDVAGDSLRLHHEHHIMDANQSSYTLYIPVRRYMHLAIANLEKNGELELEKDEKCRTARISQPAKDVIESYGAGIFTARLPMDIKEGEDQQFNVNLYMANCASALVLDTLSSHGTIKSLEVYASGFATGLNLADSTYNFAYTPKVRARQVPSGDAANTPLCYAAVTFPSKDVDGTKSVEDVEDPFESEPAGETLWKYTVYTTLKDGSITETVLGVKMPLRAGQVKVIKASIQEDGSCAPREPYVGATVKLEWREQPDLEIDF